MGSLAISATTYTSRYQPDDSRQRRCTLGSTYSGIRMADSAGNDSESRTGTRRRAVVTGPNCGVGRSSRRSSPCSPFHRMFEYGPHHAVRIETLAEQTYQYSACSVLPCSLTYAPGNVASNAQLCYRLCSTRKRTSFHPPALLTSSELGTGTPADPEPTRNMNSGPGPR